MAATAGSRVHARHSCGPGYTACGKSFLGRGCGGCSPAESQEQRDLDNCGPVSPDDAKTIAWLAELRQQGKLSIDEPRAGHCDSGSRASVGATVESGGSRQVEEFFSTKTCNIKVEIADPCEAKDGSDLYSVWLLKNQGWTLRAGLRSN